MRDELTVIVEQDGPLPADAGRELAGKAMACNYKEPASPADNKRRVCDELTEAGESKHSARG
jgi:hypothetical protein